MSTDGFWVAQEPREWPTPPGRFSFSSLSEIDSCPRRWALENANYPELWPGRGYPTRPSVQQLCGEVVHLALNEVTQRLADAGATEPANVVPVLRSMGGLSQLVLDCIARVLSPLKANPRVRERVEATGAKLAQHDPALRLEVQAALSVVWRCPEDGTAQTGHRGQGDQQRALGHGQHPEVWLAPESLPMVGRADLIRLDSRECEIVDYKTGGPDPSHTEQLREYALLWARDRVLNPDGRLATDLVVLYGTDIHRIPGPSESELARVEEDVRTRCKRAAERLLAIPPPANVATDNCRYCDVKHLCSPYWSSMRSDEECGDVPSRFTSLQALVLSRKGERLWNVTIEKGPHLTSGQAAMAVVGRHNCWHSGTSVRFMDVRVDQDDDNGSVVIVAGESSELFALPG